MQRQNATQRRALAMVIGEDEKGANIAHLDRSLVENQDHAGQHPHFDVFCGRTISNVNIHFILQI